MTHLLIQSDPALDELRRKLRESEITYAQYKADLRTLPEPPTVWCETCKRRPASQLSRGVATCEVCALQARTARRRG